MTDTPRRRCAHPETLALSSAEYAWPRGTPLTWCLDSTVPATLATVDVGATLTRAFAPWAEVAPLEITRVADPAAARLLVRFGPIDGPDGILGETQLPAATTPDSQLVMLLDESEFWTADYLEAVARHEFGHFLGVGHHDPADGTSAIMDPYYNAAVVALQAWDVAQDQERYGALTSPPSDPPAASTATPSPAGGSAPVAGASFALDVNVPAPGRYTVTITASPALTADVPAAPATPAADTTVKPGAPNVGILAKLFASSVLPIVAGLLERAIHAELQSGSPLNTAISTVLANLEAHIPDAALREEADTLLKSLLAVVEGQLDKVVPPAAA